MAEKDQFVGIRFNITDAFRHEGQLIATIVTPLDCGRCHIKEAEEFGRSHHAKGGNILASLDNFLAETVEGSRIEFNPHSPTPGKAVDMVSGLASAYSGCQQCHGAKVAIEASDGGLITVDDLVPDADGRPTDLDAVGRIARDEDGKPLMYAGTWPNTGIGRLNLDGSLGSCAACHSRHDFSPRRARQPENCGKCHLGPDHPDIEIYEASKHGQVYHSDGENWVWKGANCLQPEYRHCMISLSRGGSDASVRREFDAVSKTFVMDGFYVPESKARVGWKDENTLWVGTDSHGLDQFDPLTNRFAKLRHQPSNVYSLNDDHIRSLFQQGLEHAFETERR